MKGKILVIEDNQIWQERLKKYLEKDGFMVTIAPSVEAAIEEVKNNRFHFITLDMQLVDGKSKSPEPELFEGWSILELAKKLRTQLFTPIIVITGYKELYEKLKKEKTVQGLFLMAKQEFDREKLLEIINREVTSIDLRFKDDFRN